MNMNMNIQLQQQPSFAGLTFTLPTKLIHENLTNNPNAAHF